MKMRSLAVAGLALAVLSAAPPQQGRQYRTPRQCFDAFVAAQDRDDFAALVACLAPQTQKDAAAFLALESLKDRARLTASKEDEDRRLAKKLAPVFDALDRHGLSANATRGLDLAAEGKQRRKTKQAVLALARDPAALLADLLAALDRVNGGRPKDEEKVEQKLTELKIDGDAAAGVLVTTARGKDVKEPVKFVKVRGGWRIIPPLPFDADFAEQDRDKK
jgi:hypothetical protein